MRHQQHPCSHPHCDVLIPVNHFACQSHWFDLPSQLRKMIAKWSLVNKAAPDWAQRKLRKAREKAVTFWRSLQSADSDKPQISNTIPFVERRGP